MQVLDDWRVPEHRGNESFDVRFQTFQGDLTGARVVVDGTMFIDAAVVGTRGPYAIWQATVPSLAGTSTEYVIEVTDGTVRGAGAIAHV